jgi:signal transduction histidine kinase/CheY-like chemotaxis protein
MQLEKDITASLDRVRQILHEEVVSPKCLQHKASLSSIIDLLKKVHEELLEKETAMQEKELIKSELNQSEENFKMVFENMDEAFALHEIILDNAGKPVNYRFIEINNAFELLTGLPAHQIIGKTVLEILPYTEKFWIESYGEVALTRQSKVFSNYSKELNKHYYIKTFSPKPGFFAVLFTDITEQVKADQEMKAAKDKAEENDRLKTAFLHNISHEVRTPMNAILGFSEMICRPDQTEDKLQSYAEKIQQGAYQLLEIINNIIELSQLEANLLKVTKDEFNLKKFISEIYNSNLSKAKTKELEFFLDNTDIDDKTLIKSDPSKISKAINHIVDNAIKYTSKGHVSLTCSKKRNMLEFKVKDTGIGIPNDKIDLIFEPFRQLEIGDSRSYGGNGLGLSIARSYIRLLGGKIDVDSHQGSGSTFAVTIPAEIKHKIEEQVAEFISMDENASLLIVEDDKANYEYISNALEDLFATIYYAKNGKEAIDFIRVHDDIGIILMDIRMPEMDGITAAQIIKTIKPGLPIIAQSAFALENDIEQYDTDTFDTYLIKPIRYNQLIEVIKKYLVVK